MMRETICNNIDPPAESTSNTNVMEAASMIDTAIQDYRATMSPTNINPKHSTIEANKTTSTEDQTESTSITMQDIPSRKGPPQLGLSNPTKYKPTMMAS